MIEEKSDKRPGFGQARFLVRGRVYLDLRRAAVLRPSYDEYPERVALDIGFPQPGRRGPSRPPSATGGGGAGGGAGAGAGAGGGTGPIVLPGSIYPRARDRGGRDVTLPVSSLTDAQNAALAQSCPIPEGDNFERGPGVAATTNSVLVSNLVNRPFVVTHAYGYHGGGANSQAQFQLKVATDADSSGGNNTTGIRLFGHFEGNQMVDPGIAMVHIYPNIRFPSPPYFIKYVFDNQTAAAVDFILGMDVIYF